MPPIAAIDRQGLALANLSTLAAQLPDYDPTAANASLTGNPAYLLDPTSALVTNMVSQIHFYQRYFYINNF